MTVMHYYYSTLLYGPWKYNIITLFIEPPMTYCISYTWRN